MQRGPFYLTDGGTVTATTPDMGTPLVAYTFEISIERPNLPPETIRILGEGLSEALALINAVTNSALPGDVKQALLNRSGQ